MRLDGDNVPSHQRGEGTFIRSTSVIDPLKMAKSRNVEVRKRKKKPEGLLCSEELNNYVQFEKALNENPKISSSALWKFPLPSGNFRMCFCHLKIKTRNENF